MITKQHTFSLECPSCGGTAQADRTIKNITCSYCGNDLVLDPHSAVGKAVSLQALLSIPGEMRQSEERRLMLSREMAILKKKIRILEREGFFTSLRLICAILLFALIYGYGTAVLGSKIHFGKIDVPKFIAIPLAPAPFFALFLHEFPFVAGVMMTLPIIGAIVAQAQLSQVPDETREELEEKIAVFSEELQTVNLDIREHQKMIELYRDVVPRLVG